MEQATHAPHVPPPNRAAQIQQAVHALSLKFMNCHECLADHTCMLATLLREAESRGILLHEAFALADAQYWLQHIDWQTKFLRVVLAFTQAPSRTTLRPLIELYGRDRERMRVEVEILARQLEYRLAHFAQPDDSAVKTVDGG
jgi:hypothetical protein